ncbi:enoyl-CoA hydratase-related protein [Sphingomonas sp. OTU376]|uniref:enoyl-CoA hydratase-related protein n=1 Tax=Sphingomonas sp. OTU376 TaxID=3043863 RepID=UPI00313CC546
MGQVILRADAEGVVTITLNRPDKMNALTEAMYGQLADILSDVEADAGARAVLLRANGANFSAGNDLADFASAAAGEPGGRQVLRFLDRLATAPLPVVAAVQGQAIGIGTTMLLHCDIVIVADTARLSVPFVKLGLVPEAASSRLLPARIGHARAFEMFALGESIDAREAVSLGIANRCVAIDVLDREAAGQALRIARLPPGAVAATKCLMRDARVLSEQMAREDGHFSAALQTPEVRAALDAFAARREAGAPGPVPTCDRS